MMNNFFKKVQENKMLVKDARIASFLIKNGCVVRSIAPNKFITNSTVFYFDDSEEIEALIEEYVAQTMEEFKN